MQATEEDEVEGEVIFSLPRVEVYKVQGQERVLLHTGALIAEAVSGLTSAVGSFGVRLRVAGVEHTSPLLPRLSRECCVLEPVPGVFLFSSAGGMEPEPRGAATHSRNDNDRDDAHDVDDGDHDEGVHNHQPPPTTASFLCIAVADDDDESSAPDNSDVLRDLVQGACTYQKGAGFDDAAARRAQQKQEDAASGQGQAAPSEPTTLLGVPSRTISENVRSGASGLAWGIVAAATLLGRGIRSGTEVAVERGWISSAEDTEETTQPVDPRIRNALQASKQASSTVHRAAENVATAVGAAAWYAASKAMDSLPESSDPSNSAEARAMTEVAEASIIGLGEVVDAMEAAAVGLYQASVEATSKAVQHRYGDETAASAVDALATGGHMVGAALSMRMVGKRRIIKTFASKTMETAVLHSAAEPAAEGIAAGPPHHQEALPAAARAPPGCSTGPGLHRRLEEAHNTEPLVASDGAAATTESIAGVAAAVAPASAS